MQRELNENELSYKIIGAAIEIHKSIAPQKYILPYSFVF